MRVFGGHLDSEIRELIFFVIIFRQFRLINNCGNIRREVDRHKRTKHNITATNVINLNKYFKFRRYYYAKLCH